MKRLYLYPVLAVLALCSCAKDPVEGPNDDSKLYFDSWAQVFHPGASRTALGSVLIEDTPGTGTAAGTADDYPCVQVRYTVRALDGSVVSSTDERLNRQLGSYVETGYYGPIVWNRTDGALLPGVEEAVAAMRCGGSRTLAIPGWLLGSYTRYDTAQEYIDNVSGADPRIYEIHLDETIRDLKQWTADSLGRYVSRQFPGKGVLDSLAYGIYYFRTGKPSSEESFKNDTTIYVNYIGRRLDGTVFDTNVKDTAKFYGIYSASQTYGPAKMKWYSSEGTYSDMTMTLSGSSSSSSVIKGFSYALDHMHPHEKGTAIFSYDWGYGASGSGATIPAYSPLRFDFEIVDQP